MFLCRIVDYEISISLGLKKKNRYHQYGFRGWCEWYRCLGNLRLSRHGKPVPCDLSCGANKEVRHSLPLSHEKRQKRVRHVIDLIYLDAIFDVYITATFPLSGRSWHKIGGGELSAKSSPTTTPVASFVNSLF